MSAYGIDIFNFEFWQGPAPTTAVQHVAEHHRPGSDGTALQLVGTWGDPFEVTLTSHWAGQIEAFVGAQAMKAIIGTGWVPLKYNDINYTGITRTGYHVMAVDVIDARSNVLLVGPGYSYAGGCALVTRFQLIPEQL